MQCVQCQQQFEYLPDDIKLMRHLDPVIGGKKYELPLSDSCSDCRARQRFAFRNERSIYQRKCDHCSKNIITMYQPGKQPNGQEYKIYCNDCWWDDAWSGEDYARDYDFSRPFFEQFAELKRDVPRLALARASTNNNCDYNNYMNRCSNCYLSFVIYDSENIYYSYWMLKDNKDCYNCTHSNYVELCFDCVNCTHCYGCKFLLYSDNCIECLFSANLKNCSDCFLCTNLINKKYYILNQAYSVEDYFKKLKEYDLTKYSNWQKAKEKLIKELLPARIVRHVNQIKCQDCLGNEIVNGFRAYYCFDSIGVENCRYFDGNMVKDCMDLRGGDIERGYMSVFVGWGQNIYFDNHVLNSSDVYYGDLIESCKNCFGCSGLKNQTFSIFNKKYEEKEYYRLVDQIIEQMKKTGEWGQFFPYNLNQFGYNESSAMDIYPLNKNQAVALNIPWSDYQPPRPKAEKIVKAVELPDDINDVTDDILNIVVECPVSGKLFKYIKEELTAYKKNQIPLPRLHHDERHKERLSLRSPRKLWDRRCDKCGKDIKTVYYPDRPEKVYCEECYQKEIY